MDDNDTLTYRIKRTAPLKPGDSLITRERGQKLDLLLHLLTNLPKSLLVCGPKGIGKTTLLQKARDTLGKSWFCCLLQAQAELSFEGILRHIGGAVNAGQAQSGLPLSVTLGQLAARGRKLAVLIDNAGELAPGLLTSLLQYAAANPALRLVFALTHDELYLKNQTDRAVDDCHLIELPPLSNKQSLEFLRHLAGQRGSPFPADSINEAAAAKIYRKTHGIPGRIIAELPEFPKAKTEVNPLYPLLAAVAVLIVIALGIQLYSGVTPAGKTDAAARTVLPEKPAREPAYAAAQSENAALPAAEAPSLPAQARTPAVGAANPADFGPADAGPSVAAPSVAAAASSSSAAADIVASGGVETPSFSVVAEFSPPPQNASERSESGAPAAGQPVTGQPVAVQPAAGPRETGAPASAAENGDDWITSQPPENYTLQVMALTKEETAQAIIRRHRELEPRLTYFKAKPAQGRGREKYLLLYGSFDSKKAALEARKALPPDFQKAYPRQFAAVAR